MIAEKQERRAELCVASGLAVLVAGCLSLSLVACGAPVSENASSVGKGELTGGSVATEGVQPGPDQNDRKAISSSQTGTNPDERDNRSNPGVPDVVEKQLGSIDPRDRYRALEHWDVKGGNAPLEPVFEAMEDEDENVREKATAIAEQRWAEKHE